MKIADFLNLTISGPLGSPAYALWRVLRVTIVLSIGGAWIYSLVFNERFVRGIADATCIVVLTQALIAAGRVGLNYFSRRSVDGFERGTVLRGLSTWPRWQLMTPWVVVSSAVGYFGGSAAGDMILAGFDPAGSADMNRHMMVFGFSVAIAFTTGVTYFVYMQSRMFAMEARTQKAISAAAENQLRLLQSQLEPHMLFNTLANLRTLIDADPRRAKGMLDHLIGFLRSTLEASRLGTHPLSVEFDHLKDYLELMQIRMADRLETSFSLPAELSRLPVPPLLLQPIVENAIKHGLEPKMDGGRIEINASLSADFLLLTVRDTGVGLTGLSKSGSKFGLEHVRQRLSTLYGDAGTLSLDPIADAEGGMLAVVRIPLITEEKS